MTAVSEILAIRGTYVDGYVQRRIDQLAAMDHQITTAEITTWENQAHAMWRDDHPALSSLLPSRLAAVTS